MLTKKTKGQVLEFLSRINKNIDICHLKYSKHIEEVWQQLATASPWWKQWFDNDSCQA